jgi:hypothetical protein
MTTIEIYRGDTTTIPFSVSRSTLPVDLTSAVIWFTLKSSVVDADVAAVLQKSSVDGGITILDQTTDRGKASINLAPGDTATLGLTVSGPVVYQYDIQVKEASGRVSTVATGAFVLRPDVTRSTA